MKDPIVEEVHKGRQKRAVAFKHDIDALAADIKRHESLAREQGARFVTPPKRKKSKVG